MAQEYNRHLAAAVLNDGRIMSYRLLSRELKVHANIAKRMLYDFHQIENVRKPGSVHATYLLDGIPKPIVNEVKVNGHHSNDDDAQMQSSPFASSAAQQEDKAEEIATPAKSIILAREEDLQAAKEKLETLQSIHIYSLQPSALQNLQSLSDCNRTVSSTFMSEDPLVAGQQYGVIQNSKVKRRTARRPLGVAPSVAAATRNDKIIPKPSPNVLDINKAEVNGTKQSSQESVKKAEGKHVSKTSNKASNRMPALKKEQSDIFKSFSKPTSTLKRETTDSSVVESPAPASQDSSGPEEEDQVMQDMSDDEQEENYFVPENKANGEASHARSQRAEQLRKMMDEDEDDNDDQEMEDTEKDTVAAEEPSPDSAAAVDDDSTTIPNEPTAALEPALPQPAHASSSSSGQRRRRGRRKVMKKKTTKDEEGYLVTREEPAWESFSEDEPGPPLPPSAKERTPASSAAASASAKGGRKAGSGGAKPGQGNIMSFFGKK